VIVVDDGSSDQTSRAAEQSEATVIRHSKTLGKGAALASGFRHARARGFQWALMLDGDGQHLPSDAPLLLQAAEESGAQLVVGNRMADTSPMPWLRKKVNQWMSRELSRIAGRELPDSQCGFRLMHLETWASLELTTSHFEIESELLLACVLAGHLVEFVPIHTVYQGETSRIHPVRDGVRWFRWWWGIRKRAMLQRNGRLPSFESRPKTDQECREAISVPCSDSSFSRLFWCEDQRSGEMEVNPHPSPLPRGGETLIATKETKGRLG
jgi:glycosyltransferase involved in cell wall biosynthesis